MALKETSTRIIATLPSPVPGARRQAAYADRQRKAGRKQRSFWLTDHETVQVAVLIEKMRGGK